MYESGVTFSFEQWGAGGAATYLQSGKLPAAYDDPKDAKSHGAASLLSQVPARWDNAGSKDKQLEQIMTQKWIALFPDGPEAWAEYRRTGYPKLFPVVNNFSGGTIDTDIQIRRLPFPQNEQNSNAAELAKAVTLLGGGQDNGGTRLWWDVTDKGF